MDVISSSIVNACSFFNFVEATATQTKRRFSDSMVSYSDYEATCADEKEQRTTLILRNVPYSCTQDHLFNLLNSQGFECCFDFLYMPTDLRNRSCFGYAFVNFTTPEEASRAMTRLNGFSNWPVSSQKVCVVDYSEREQGLDAYIVRFRNSPVMHADVPDEFKPHIYSNGKRAAFPEPTKPIRTMRAHGRVGRNNH